MSSTRPGAASTCVRTLVEGPQRPARLLGASPAAVYLVTDAGVVALLAADAVRLPLGIVLPALPTLPSGGDLAAMPAFVGAGGATVGDLSVRVTRWWEPPRLPAVRPAPWPWLEDELAARPLEAPVAAALRDVLVELGRRRSPSVDGLVGAGRGLTPAGDDVLCGLLLGLGAAGAGAQHTLLAAAVRERSSSTTTLSAALLDRAAGGSAVPQVAALLAAEPGAAAGAALIALLAVGASSGADLAHGLAAGLRAAGEAEVTPA